METPGCCQSATTDVSEEIDDADSIDPMTSMSRSCRLADILPLDSLLNLVANASELNGFDGSPSG